jgi:putative cell wall-binding protein/DNA-binding beta-propeller fold protein YncE
MIDFKASRVRGPVAVGVLLAILATIVVGGGSASATPRHVTLARLAESAGISDGISGMVIDSVTQRGYVVNQQHGTVEVYDISGSAFVPIATIATGLGLPMNLALNETTHTLVVSDRATPNRVDVIDVDPASVTVNQVLRAFPTGGDGPSSIAVDADANVVFVANRSSDNVTMMNIDDGSTRLIPAGRSPVDVVVDPVGHKAYVSSTADSRITTINADGSYSSGSIENAPEYLAFSEGRLLVSTSKPFAPHVESYDVVSWVKTAVSPALPTNPNDLAVDPELHLVYLVNAAGGVPGIQTLRSGTLESEDSGDEDYYRAVTVEPKTHRVFASETYRLGGSHVDMFEPHPSPLPSVDRLGGADRFAVSAAVSADAFSSGIPVAYVASGAVFPDALSGSAAAGAEGGPVLLVTKDSIPPATAAELARLRPQRIVVLGGTATISAAVETQLGPYSRSVTRLAGADRFEVSAAVSAAAFPGGAKVVYLASGAVFPDALSGSAVAGHDDGPVLLVQKDGVPASVATELDRLKPQYVIVLGGAKTVGESVVTTLQSKYPVIRVDGSDRFAVSAAVSARTFPVGTYTVYVASGAVFPDALSGSAAAIANDGPVLLVTGDSIPVPVAAELDRLNPYRIVVLGGTNTVSDAVVTQLQSYLPS